MSAREVAIQRFYPWLARYRRQVADEPYGAIHLRDAYLAGFLVGGAYSVKASAALAGLVPTLDLLNELLGAELEDRARD